MNLYDEQWCRYLLRELKAASWLMLCISIESAMTLCIGTFYRNRVSVTTIGTIHCQSSRGGAGRGIANPCLIVCDCYVFTLYKCLHFSTSSKFIYWDVPRYLGFVQRFIKKTLFLYVLWLTGWMTACKISDGTGNRLVNESPTFVSFGWYCKMYDLLQCCKNKTWYLIKQFEKQKGS